jgi:TonB family protein
MSTGAAIDSRVADLAVVVPEPPPAPAFDLTRAGIFVWAAGAMAGAALLLIGVGRLLRLTARAEIVGSGHWHRLAREIGGRYRLRRRVVLLQTGASDVVATWGLLRPRILLPAQAAGWSEDRARLTLCHEMAHIRRFDWPVQVAAELLRIVFWPNPLLWVLCARLRRESEQACDDVVLGTGVPAAAYASHLLDVARAFRRPPRGWVPALPMARPSTLEWRVTAMLNSSLNRQAPTWRTRTIIAAVLAAVVLPAASLQLSAQDPGPGALTGRVYDRSGAVLPGARITLTDERKAQRTAVSDGTGWFQFAPAPAGEYLLEVTLAGFRTLHTELRLQEPDDWTRNVTMQVGEVQETIRVTGKRPTRTVPAVPAASNRPVRVGGVIKPPMKTKHVPPIYPAAMQEAGLEALVQMDALIGTDGKVVSVRVVGSQIHPAFAAAAEAAVRQWEFTPTRLNNEPVEVEMAVSVQFTLED